MREIDILQNKCVDGEKEKEREGGERERAREQRGYGEDGNGKGRRRPSSMSRAMAFGYNLYVAIQSGHTVEIRRALVHPVTPPPTPFSTPFHAIDSLCLRFACCSPIDSTRRRYLSLPRSTFRFQRQTMPCFFPSSHLIPFVSLIQP